MRDGGPRLCQSLQMFGFDSKNTQIWCYFCELEEAEKNKFMFFSLKSDNILVSYYFYVFKTIYLFKRFSFALLPSR